MILNHQPKSPLLQSFAVQSKSSAHIFPRSGVQRNITGSVEKNSGHPNKKEGHWYTAEKCEPPRRFPKSLVISHVLPRPVAPKSRVGWLVRQGPEHIIYSFVLGGSVVLNQSQTLVVQYLLNVSRKSYVSFQCLDMFLPFLCRIRFMNSWVIPVRKIWEASYYASGTTVDVQVMSKHTAFVQGGWWDGTSQCPWGYHDRTCPLF